jgi:DNA-binding transcriptional MerR regulator
MEMNENETADNEIEPVDASPEADAEAVQRLPRPVAQKEYYSISEVCDLVGLKPHVLRYWETQFPLLNPSKNRSGNRVYQRKEIKLILFVKHLLYEDKFTVEGAKQKMEQLRKGGELQIETKKVLDRQMVGLLRAEMQHLTELLTPTKPIPQP